MKRTMKKIIAYPAYGLYVLVADWILGMSMPDAWEKVEKWINK